MDSIFSKKPSPPPDSPYGMDRIEKEIEHVRQRAAVREKRGERSVVGRVLVVTIVLALGVLYFMDPFLYAWRKGEAIKAYAYLHENGDEAPAQALTATGIFSPREVAALNAQAPVVPPDYPSTAAAEREAMEVEGYLARLSALHSGHDEQLDAVGKIRYDLFVRWGIGLPTQWDMLTPVVE
jgi:hypothetical protein